MINTDPAALLDLFNKILAGRANESEILELIAWLMNRAAELMATQVERELKAEDAKD